MSFLAGRLAATEGSFFSQTSRQALSRLKEKLAPPPSLPPSPTSTSTELQADVLPQILQHSLPQNTPSSSPLPSTFSAPPSSLAASLSSVNPSPHRKFRSSQSIFADANSPLAFFASVPQTSFGPKRWKPESDEVFLLASTANDARMDYISNVDVARAKAVVDGYFSVLKAFVVATTLMVGGATILAVSVCSSLHINSIDEIRSKGHEYMQPRAEAIRQQFKPWKHWAEQKNKALHMDESQYKPYVTNFGESLGLKQSLGPLKRKEER